jgi:hypothetical protein
MQIHLVFENYILTDNLVLSPRIILLLLLLLSVQKCIWSLKAYSKVSEALSHLILSLPHILGLQRKGHSISL